MSDEVKAVLREAHKLVLETLDYLQKQDVAIPEFGTTLHLMTKRNDLLAAAIEKGEPANDFDGKARITGDLVDAAMVRTVLVRIGTIKDSLYTLAASGAIPLRPTLHGLAAVGLPPAAALSLEDQEAVQRLRDWVEAVAEAMESVFKQCFCDALLPPCPPCDDPAVPLARIDVQGCEVVNICNLRRRFVVTPAALSHWFGGFAPLMNMLRGACRPSGEAEDVAAAQAEDRREQRVEKRKQAPQAVVDLDTTFESPQTWKKVGVEPDFVSPAAVAAVAPTPEVLDIHEPVLPRAVHLALFRMAGLPDSDLRRALSLAFAAAGRPAVKLKSSEPRREAAPRPVARVAEGEEAAGAEDSSGPAASATEEETPLSPEPHAPAPRKRTAKKKNATGRAAPKKTAKKPAKKPTRKKG